MFRITYSGSGHSRVLLDNDLLIRTPRRWILNNFSWMAHQWMRYAVEPRDVSPRSPPGILCHPTPISQRYDMVHKISKGIGYHLWLKRYHVCRRPQNVLHTSVLSHHPLRQTTTLHHNASHDPTRVSTNILKRHNILVIIVRDPYEILHHQPI